ncbi:MAG: glutathione S-transferase family protein [Rhizobiaceae bacterium]|nr:glutathione S-transferase family protein [Rhizobiaceae bacterium]
MLILKSFEPAINVRCPSAFGLKADALLAMSGLEYKVVPGDIRKSPMGKLPVLIDGKKIIADTSLIQKYLENAHGVDFDGALTSEQRATAKAIQRMVENHLYFAMVHFRWIENPERVRDTLFKNIPSLPRKFIFKMVLKKVKQANEGHGISRHDLSDILAFAMEDLEALSVLLGAKPFMFGKKPTSVDASVFGALENIINSTETSDLQDGARGFENLVEYCDRFRDEVFND